MNIRKMALSATLFLTLAPSATYANPAPKVDCDTVATRERNWSKCNKQGINYHSKDFGDSIFHMTNFSNANLSGAFLEFSDFTGANLIGANLVGTHLEFSIWTNGHLCDENSVGMCNQLSLDETYVYLLALFDKAKQDNQLDDLGWVRYYRILAQNSLNVVLADIHTTYQQALLAHSDNIDNIEDPISYDEINNNDIVVLLEKSNCHLEVYKIDSFRNYVNSDNFRIRALTNDAIRIRN